MRSLSFTTFPNTRETQVVSEEQRTLSWEQLVPALSTRREADSKDKVRMFCGAEFRSGGKRCGEDLIGYNMLLLDFDDGIHPRYFIQEHKEYEFVLYTSWSNAEGKPKFRVVLPLVEEVSADTYRLARSSLISRFPDADEAGFNVSQAFYLPSGPEEHFFSYHNTGEWFDFTAETSQDMKKRQLKSLIRELELLSNPTSFGPNSLNDAVRVLNRIDPDVSYELWTEIGFCMKGMFGEEAFQAYFDWSSKGSKFNSYETQLYRKWCGFRDESRYGMGWLVNRAKENPAE